MKLLWGWDLEAEEVFDSQEKAIEDYISQQELFESDLIQLYAYKRCEIDLSADEVLQYCLGLCDDAYACENPSGPTPAMIEAAEHFVAIFKQEYIPWACERLPEHDVVINIKGK